MERSISQRCWFFISMMIELSTNPPKLCDEIYLGDTCVIHELSSMKGKGRGPRLVKDRKKGVPFE